ncbi:MAG: tape measure protein, partial [Magnetococcales bacterium]|nr:tape measure protein [Magnetococcales bacterium]
PGAFSLAAKAMGVSEKQLAKMMEQGQLMAEDLLPALADLFLNELGASAEQATSGAQAAFNRLFNALLDDKEILAKEVNPELAKLADTLVKSLNDPEVQASIKGFGHGIAEIIGFLREHGQTLVWVAGGLVAWKLATMSTSAVLSLATGNTKTWSSALQAVGAESTLTAIAFGKFGAAAKVVGDSRMLQLGEAVV